MSTATTTCPAWCVKHPDNELESHQGAIWQGAGLTVVVEHTRTDGTTIEVDTEPGESGFLSLTPEQTEELGLELIRVADRIREAERLTPDA